MFEEEEEMKGGMIPKIGHRGGWKRLEMEMRWSEDDEMGLLRCVENGLEEVCGEEDEEVMMRVSFNAYDVYRLNSECGEVELMRYEVYKSEKEGSYVVLGVGVDKRHFRRLVEKMGGEEKEEEERRSSLVASRNELEMVEDMRDILSYIKSCYYEHKRCGYKSLLAKLGKGEEETCFGSSIPNNLKGVVSDVEWKAIQQRISGAKKTEAKKQGGEEEEILEMMKMDIEGSDDLTLLVVLCLKKMRGEKRMEILMERKGMKRKEERKLVFDFGVLSRKRAEEIVGEGMVGRYLMYELESGDKKIIEYHSWSLEGGKYFKEYEIGEGIEGEEVWYELSRKGMLWYEAVVYKSGMERVIERELDEVKKCS